MTSEKFTIHNNLVVAIESAIVAGEAILEIYNSGDFEVQLKTDNSPLTKADIASHKAIVSYLSKTDIPVLSEEGKTIAYQERKNWKKLWIVDPIDGTKEFIKKNGEFTVNIALVENQIPICGVVYAPALGTLYFSGTDLGAYKLVGDFENFNLEKDIQKAIKLPIEREDKTYTIVASRSHRSKETDDYIDEIKEKHGEVNIISKGSSLKLCMVAEGLADCYPRFAPTIEWDTAAGQAICIHAGYRVIDWQTKENMLYNKEDLLNNWFLVG